MNSWLSQVEAAETVLARRAARSGLVAYLRWMNLGFEPARHHRLLIGYLEAVSHREIPRLMVLFPPGSGKSIYTSVLFASWYLGLYPTHNLLSASHSTELAEKFGRRVRGLFSSPEHRAVFNVGVSPTSAAAGRWSTTAGGDYFAAGVGTGLSGLRSNCLIIDDPLRSREDADSMAIRDKIWDWYQSDCVPRLKPDAVQILITTRWHPLDLAGRLLTDMNEGGPAWTVLSVPMECESADDPLERKIGERLWPEWFTADMVTLAKRNPRNWAALYQQRPTIDGGNLLRRAWWKYWEGPLPVCRYTLQSWDTAFSERAMKSSSYSARTTWGVFTDRNEKPALLLLDAWHDRVDYPDLKKEALRAYQAHHPDAVLIEKKASGISLIQDLRRHGVPIVEYQPDRDKIARAYAVQAMLESGQIYVLPRPWAEEVITECEQFPNGPSTDWVDSNTQAWLRLRNSGLLTPGRPEPNPLLDEDDTLFPSRESPITRSIYG